MLTIYGEKGDIYERTTVPAPQAIMNVAVVYPRRKSRDESHHYTRTDRQTDIQTDKEVECGVLATQNEELARMNR